jgi:hypothetical protein
VDERAGEEGVQPLQTLADLAEPSHPQRPADVGVLGPVAEHAAEGGAGQLEDLGQSGTLRPSATGHWIALAHTFHTTPQFLNYSNMVQGYQVQRSSPLL